MYDTCNDNNLSVQNNNYGIAYLTTTYIQINNVFAVPRCM